MHSAEYETKPGAELRPGPLLPLDTSGVMAESKASMRDLTLTQKIRPACLCLRPGWLQSSEVIRLFSGWFNSSAEPVEALMAVAVSMYQAAL